MKVFVNNEAVDLFEGMTVKHALIRANMLGRLKAGQRVYDEWGNEIGLDGSIHENMKIYVRPLTPGIPLPSGEREG